MKGSGGSEARSDEGRTAAERARQGPAREHCSGEAAREGVVVRRVCARHGFATELLAGGRRRAAVLGEV
uniref:Uncharacterized protein n=1 Tax=Arundo donax TaxID=35708 RepID=A0A0A9CHX5_ARUDO